MIIITQENRVICDKCGLTVVVDKVEYPQGHIPLVSRPPTDWAVINRGYGFCGSFGRTFCPKHKVELKGAVLVVDGIIFNT